MIILAFDCAGAACSVAVVRDGTVLARDARALLHGQAEVLVPMIQATLAAAGLGHRDLHAIATTLGPGSFTGLRAGIATARGLALATGLPAVGVSTLEASAHAVVAAERRGASVTVAIDTRRDDLFVQTFGETLVPAGQPRIATASDAAALAPPGALVLAGDATEPLLAALQAAGRNVAVASSAGPVDAAVVAGLGAARLAAGSTDPLRPLYLRAPDVTPAPARRR